MSLFWIFDISPQISAITGPRPKVINGDTDRFNARGYYDRDGNLIEWSRP